ncbi:hypothetical protein AB0C59_03410 [Streptomyces sp. NPDC048664]|uniref:DUF7144 family membrane protein n=1 Tax=Streptomyces sp. NPDC048664 TaxID=3154505 RepID=UPI003428BDBD
MTSMHTTPTRSTKQLWAQGLMMFASVMLMVVGVLDIFRGIMGIAANDVAVTTPNYVFRFDLTGWGWVHLVLGAVAVVIGMGLMSRAATWARVGGVAIAGFIIIASFLSLPYYPFWSVVMMALSAFVVWALCVARPEGDSQARATDDTRWGTPRTM